MLQPDKLKWIRKILFLSILAASLVTALGSLCYILGDPANFSYPFLPKYQKHLILVRTHGVAAALTLILGPLGFIQTLPYHKRRGQLYMTSVMLGTITAVPLSVMAEGGITSVVGFLIMSLLWGFTGIKAWQAARSRDFAAHRLWVFRNFALSFGAVVFRAYLYQMQQWDIPFHQIYPSAVWVCWIPVMVIAEFLAASKTIRVEKQTE